MNTLLGPGGQVLTPTAAPDRAAPAAGHTAGAVVETTTRTFMQDVIEASRDMVVLVDFWAPWCGPCKQLGPALEKAVSAYDGKVRLVTMNIDEHPEVAGQLGIRSIPAVFAFRQGQPMDAFVGAQTESQIRTFLERVAGPANDGAVELLAQADAAQAAGEYDQALMLYSEVVQIDPENAHAIAGLGMVSLAAGNVDAAREILAQIPEPMRREAPIEALEAAVKLHEQAASLGGSARLRRAVDADPGDHQARLDLATALAGEGDRAGAVAELIEIMRRDREWNESGAQKALVNFFEAWGPKDPATITGRRKMASILFA